MASDLRKLVVPSGNGIRYPFVPSVGLLKRHQAGNHDGLVDAVPFALYTHGGIHELSFRGKYYVRATGLLDDGQGNPPAGWDNPYQRGALTIYTDRAVFSDAKGHLETFTIRPGATTFETVCS